MKQRKSGTPVALDGAAFRRQHDIGGLAEGRRAEDVGNPCVEAASRSTPAPHGPSFLRKQESR